MDVFQGSLCGDGFISGPEQCEAADLGGESCATLGMGQGPLACDPLTCQFDLSACDFATDPSPTSQRPYPDGVVYEPPRTIEECMELSDYLLNNFFDYPLAEQPRVCACDRCLDTFVPCLVDYECLNIIACCVDAGYYDASCGISSACTGVINQTMSSGVALGLAMPLESCFQSVCRGSVPQP